MNQLQPKPFIHWLEDQQTNLQRWSRELRTRDPARFHHEIEQIEAHRDWLDQQIRQLKHSRSCSHHLV